MFDPIGDIRIAFAKALHNHGVSTDHKRVIDTAVDCLPDFFRQMQVSRIYSADFEPDGLESSEMVLSLAVPQGEVSAGNVAWCKVD